MNVLAIGCHPDDVEIACAGTLAKCARRGDNVTVCHVSTGDLGHEIIPPEELKGVTAVEIGERVHRMMADDLGPDLVAE